MGIYKRGKVWYVRFVDENGAYQRKSSGLKNKRAAQGVFEDIKSKVRDRKLKIDRPTPSNATVNECAERWLEFAKAEVKSRTYGEYETIVRIHVLPAFGDARAAQIEKTDVRDFLVRKLNSGLSRPTVRNIRAVLRAMFNFALDENLVSTNPAARLGRKPRLGTSHSDKTEARALSQRQLSRFLAAAAKDSRYYPFFFLLARTGLRLGEALALKWSDLDFDSREILVERALIRDTRTTGTTKTGESRPVDMSLQLRDILLKLEMERKRDAFSKGQEEGPPWVFTNTAGSPLDQSKADKVFKRILRAAKLPLRFSPRSLRHTFASLLLQQGESLVYVQRQLGHASIQLTADVYGRWLPMGNQAAVDRLDERDGHKNVTHDLKLTNENTVSG